MSKKPEISKVITSATAIKKELFTRRRDYDSPHPEDLMFRGAGIIDTLVCLLKDRSEKKVQSLSDLSPGIHGVQLRDGNRYIVAFSDNSRSRFLLGQNSHTPLDNYNEDFTHQNCHYIDIVKVFTVTQSTFKYMDIERNLKWKETNQQFAKSKIDSNESKIFDLEV